VSETIDPLEEILSTIRGSARRVTVAKRRLAEVLVVAKGHRSADELTTAVQILAPEVSPSTVYRLLDEFEELGIVVHSHLGHAAAVYHLAGAVHGHLVCQHCGATEEIPAAHFDALSRDLVTTYGFLLDRHHVAISGTCAICRERGAATTHH
jgi:Fur family transcriptional regulator, ferric uptake regulator